MYGSNDAVSVEAVGAVRVIKLNRPASGNAVDRDMKICLREIWDALADDSTSGPSC